MNAMYIQVKADVRYWDDAIINSVSDEKGESVPFKNGNTWEPTIRLEDGLMMNWPKGTTADIHFKVCDAGEYYLLDEDRKPIAKWGGYYVPNDFLCHGDNGYGDYIIFKVGADGLIEKWEKPTIKMPCDSDDDEEDKDEYQSSWRKLP